MEWNAQSMQYILSDFFLWLKKIDNCKTIRLRIHLYIKYNKSISTEFIIFIFFSQFNTYLTSYKKHVVTVYCQWGDICHKNYGLSPPL